MTRESALLTRFDPDALDPEVARKLVLIAGRGEMGVSRHGGVPSFFRLVLAFVRSFFA